MRYLFVLLLAGCGSTEVIKYVDRPIVVEVPVSIPCEAVVPREAVYSTDKLVISSSDFEKIQALLIERKERGATESELRLLLDSCTQ